MARKRKQLTVFQFMISQVGLRKAMKVLTFVAAWEIARQYVIDETPGAHFGIERYADWWKESRSTAYREQVLFRQAVADKFATPTELLEAAAAQRTDWKSMRLAVS